MITGCVECSLLATLSKPGRRPRKRQPEVTTAFLNMICIIILPSTWRRGGEFQHFGGVSRTWVCQFYPFRTHSFESKSLLLPIVLTSDHIDNFCFVVLPSSEKKFTTFSEARRAKFLPWPKMGKHKVKFLFYFNNLSFLQLSDFQNKSESNV